MLVKVLTILLVLIFILIFVAFFCQRQINKAKAKKKKNDLAKPDIINDVDDEKTNEFIWEENTVELNSKDVIGTNSQIDDFIIEEEIKVIHSKNII